MSDVPVTSLPTNDLQPNPFQPRDNIQKEELQDLVVSIRTYGILEPLVVAQTPMGYQIIAGERRWRAARELKLDTVPVIIKKTTPRGMLEMALVENVQRVDLSPIERAQAFQQLNRDFKFSHSEISEKIGKSGSFVSNSLRLLTLPDAIKDGLAGGQITEGHARALLGLNDPKIMVQCYKAVLKENASVRRTEELVRRFKEATGQVNQGLGKLKNIQSEEIDNWTEQLKNTFSPQSKVRLVRSVRQTKVMITLEGSPEETQEDLNKILSITKVA